MKKVILFVAAFLITITNVEAKTFSEDLISKANSKEINTYESGTKTEMYTFEHPVTEQTGALTDYRYIGNNPNNYVYFNCEDENDKETCEVWRIVGVFNTDDGDGNLVQRVKLIRGSSFSEEWDSTDNSEWSTASLNTYLNEGGYYEKLSETAKSMIGNTKYYLGGSRTYQNLAGPDYYSFERGTSIYNSTRTTNWTGKIALMYPSDYVYTYALDVDTTCFNDGNNCDKGKPDSSWIYNSNIGDGSTFINYQWTLSTDSSDPSFVFVLLSYGRVGSDDYNADFSFGVRPAVHLISDIYMLDGDGSENNPYQLTLTEPKEEVVEEPNEDVSSDVVVENPDTGINLIYIIPIMICSIIFVMGIVKFKKRLGIKNN